LSGSVSYFTRQNIQFREQVSHPSDQNRRTRRNRENTGRFGPKIQEARHQFEN